jgi:uncharacterized caspase-like protein
MKRLAVCIAFVASLCCLAHEAGAARHALVIGNSEYQFGNPLKNPRNDADLMEASLKAVGFEVTKKKDLTINQIKAAMREFYGSLSRGDFAIVYYSGHGIQYKGENYLVPIDFNAKYGYEVGDAAISLSFIMSALGESGAQPKLIVLDCCRDAPTFRSLTKSLSRGLADVTREDDETLVCFATKHGEVAADDPDQPNSNYTKALAGEIIEPGRKVDDVMKEVTRSVKAASGGKQVPYVYGNLTEDIYFVGGPRSADSAAQSGGSSSDVNGQLVREMAAIRQHLEQMTKSKSAATPVPQPTPGIEAVSRPPAPDPDPIPQSFKNFVERMWQHQSSNDASDWASDFASTVDYCYKEDGPASRGFV